MNTNQKTAVVTGSGSGIGLAVAEAFVRDGFNVVLNGRNKDKLDNAAALIGKPDQLSIITGDITNPEVANQIVNKTVEHFGQIDTLVNNAGTFSMKPFTEYTIEELDVFLGYLRGTFVLTQSAVRQMQKKGNGGSIINIGTILATNGVHGLPSSAPIASKGGVMALTKNLSVELASDNIRINAVAPGVVPTSLWHIGARFNLASANARTGRMKEAQKHQAIFTDLSGLSNRAATEEQQIKSSSLKAVQYLLDRKYPEALAEYQALAAEHPDYAPLHNAVGIIQMRLGRGNDAMEALQRAATLDPRLSEPHYLLATLYREMGDEQAAVRERQMFDTLESIPEKPSY